ncbi:hypothetical protein CEXT_120791 [Caerostris extrusa]|uniref:Uncharacterized protein n=1 Tax=Caerostris extrusa TaxID=172846 RepID=A0AAV4PNB2_CAEEX|nr:hypothetical protein CEXT_120791 [Caerostris extrusa]
MGNHGLKGEEKFRKDYPSVNEFSMGLLRFVCSDTRTLNGLQLPEEGHLPLTRGSSCGRSGASRLLFIAESSLLWEAINATTKQKKVKSLPGNFAKISIR